MDDLTFECLSLGYVGIKFLGVLHTDIHLLLKESFYLVSCHRFPIVILVTIFCFIRIGSFSILQALFISGEA